MEIFDFDKTIALRQASTMAECAEELMFQRRQINNVVDQLRNSWEGQAANIYIRQLTTFGETLERNATVLRKVADDFLKQIGEIVAELQALEEVLANTAGGVTA